MRTKKDVENSNRHNETKAKILHILVEATMKNQYLYRQDIAKLAGMTANNVGMQLTKLYGQKYIYRRKQRFGSRNGNGHRGEYEYCYLRPMGHRVAKKLWIRLKLREIDPNVSMNIKKQLTPSLSKYEQQLEIEYTQWKNSLGR